MVIEIENLKLDIKIPEVEDALNECVNSLRSLKRDLRIEQTVNVASIAHYWGISPNTVSKNVWLMPNFGVSELPTLKGRKWSLETWDRWREIPADERKKEWQKLPQEERRRIMLKSLNRA